ncbi:hypothetical protein PAAG_07715 [Paracoccidioides lutzii Pb01]|uniref:BHLH domain-containing protein n=1 Tax=Paracoccidioides lutzii (strain ATCC MYA-826 / Pb01) TaxID=502779 RepID=C1H9Y6_PARBA|nr:hypothetical protein PAAG_07715 [Paracoccidioides lutzii Pb01]EEH37159.1 hypothetical protein PAAG_07715 [Paracoccidioides lutzii Pb01]
MPKPRLPLTPASSGDIAAEEKSSNSPVEMFFCLPPAALPNSSSSSNSSSSKRSVPTRPMSPISPDIQPVETSTRSSRTSRQRSNTKKRPSAADFTLPPPPTRARKIIQMKPKTQAEQVTPRCNGAGGSEGKAKAENSTFASSGSGAGSKKKQASGATTAAGRKIARKTAHSMIERRRRSKMNEEFTTLKNMIPACRGQEMHKLAILQASIDYMNYLEQCINDLKAANSNDCDDGTETDSTNLYTPSAPCGVSTTKFNRPASVDQDQERFSSLSPSPSPSPSQFPFIYAHSHTNSTTTSPNIPRTTSTTSTTYEYEYEYPYQSPGQLSTHNPSTTANLIPIPALHASLDTSTTSSLHPLDPCLQSPQAHRQLQRQHFPNHNHKSSFTTLSTSTLSTSTVSSAPSSTNTNAVMASVNPSPALTARYAADVEREGYVDMDIDHEHEASAALLMLNVDRRAVGVVLGSSSGMTGAGGAGGNGGDGRVGVGVFGMGDGEGEKGSGVGAGESNTKKLGMSVQDLLCN